MTDLYNAHDLLRAEIQIEQLEHFPPCFFDDLRLFRIFPPLLSQLLSSFAIVASSSMTALRFSSHPMIVLTDFPSTMAISLFVLPDYGMLLFFYALFLRCDCISFSYFFIPENAIFTPLFSFFNLLLPQLHFKVELTKIIKISFPFFLFYCSI